MTKNTPKRDQSKSAWRLPSTIFCQKPATMLVYGLALYASALSLFELTAAIDLRQTTGQLSFAGSDDDPMLEAGGSLGFYAALFFALNFVFATRWPWMEQTFGGMGRVYRLHRFCGKTALSFIVLHTAILILQAMPDWSLVGKYVIPGVETSYTLGMVGTLGLLALVALTIWIKLPHHLWLKTHQLMIVPFLGGTLHAIILQQDWYMMLTAAVGTIAWAYTIFLYPGRSKQATVVQAQTRGNIRELMLLTHTQMSSEPGQFVFLSLPARGSSRHPFSLSGADSDGRVRLSIRKRGQFTQNLEQLLPDALVKLHGPYGRFGHEVLDHIGPQIWIAGGIGITPFLSILQLLSQTRSSMQLHLLWSVRLAEEAVYRHELEELMKQLPNGRLEIHVSSENGRLILPPPPITDIPAQYCLCGPHQMTVDLESQLLRTGIRRKHILSERFAIR